MRIFVLILLCISCSSSATDKLAELRLNDEARAALGRLRFSQLHNGDRLRHGDLVLCGKRDRVLVGFSKRLVNNYLGRDADWLLPELFSKESPEEVLLEIAPEQLLILKLPRGIGSETQHPDGWVREVAGYPLMSTDIRQVQRLFVEGELFASVVEEEQPPDSEPSKEVPAKARVPGERKLGIGVLPRMGPRSAGVVISSVLPDSPAARAGLEKGDRILTIAGHDVSSFRELRKAVESTNESVLVLEVVERESKKRRKVEISLLP